FFFFFQAEDGIRDKLVTGVQTCALPIYAEVLAVDQHSTANHAVLTTEKAAVWLARPASGDGYYVALFNLDSGAQTFDYSWKEVRSEERRVGKEGRAGWARRQQRENTKQE